MTERAALIEYLRAQRDHADDWRTTLAEDAADLLERDGAEIARLLRWQEDAVALCAKRQCGKRDQRIAELEADIAQVTERLHRREADLLAQMNTNIEVGNLYDAALARAEAAEKDAARYQWLRDCCNEDAVVQMQDWNEDGPTETYYEKRGAGLDAAIDAAIAEWRDTPVPVPPGECPYPIHADRSIEACVAAGDCGCGQNKT